VGCLGQEALISWLSVALFLEALSRVSDLLCTSLLFFASVFAFASAFAFFCVCPLGDFRRVEFRRQFEFGS